MATDASRLVLHALTLSANGVDLFVETIGHGGDPAVLLIMGNSAPGLLWPDDFCRGLAERGFFVIRFDQRDTGLSSYVNYDLAPYTLDDLVKDALGILDGLKIDRAHVVGLSQGGVLAYRLALSAPSRVESLAVLMSSPDLRPKNDAFTGAPVRAGELPRPAADYVAAVIALNAAVPADEEGVAVQFVENFRLAKGAASPFDEGDWLAMGRAVASRPRLRRDGLSTRMANHSHHSKAQMATPPLTAEDLHALRLPVLIIHGAGDPIFPLPHAQWAVAQIVGARLRILDGMGHALDRAFFAPITEALVPFFESAISQIGAGTLD
ncbi:alpha/beta fold hydrolase [Geothrix sp. 21YS21S-4]|uniref:alpha/beta fold hydrolase n=1 Tax=Geothrix sp. 21YS21S-4 TaxID=3068889 RepID=UPI0027B9A90A|nr:alpha/beta hydrolase [Geothrix sp. 21YS21S-4]